MLHLSIQAYFTAYLVRSTPSIFRILFSRISRTFSARSRGSSICSGLTPVAPAPLSVPAAAALTHFRSGCSISPNSLAAAPAASPSLTRVTFPRVSWTPG